MLSGLVDNMKKRKTRVITRPLGKKAPGRGGRTPFGLYSTTDGNVYIDPRQTPSELLDTMIHEMMHVAFPRMSERQVRKGATIISTTLWKKGYRRP